MVGGTKEAAIGLHFVNHRELRRPDLGKEILLQGRFYEAEMDWDMIVGYDFMMETDSGVLPAQASMTLYQDDQLSWLSSPEHHVECRWIHPERNQLEVAALDTEPTGPANQEYGVMPEVASRVVADLGASDLALDAFSSGTSAHLRVCEKYWSAQDSAWKKHWGPHQGLMWIHCPRWNIPRAVAKIRKDRSKAVLVVPMGCTEEESTRHWVVSLTNMTLNKVVLPAGGSVYQDAKGQPMPPQRWPTEFHYVDGSLDQADTTDFVCVNRIVAEPWRQRFAVSPVDIGESEDPSQKRRWIWFRGICISPFTTGEASVRARARTKPGGKWTRSSLVPMMGTPSCRGCWSTCPARTSQSGVTHPPTAIYSEARPEMALWATWEDHLSRNRAGSLPLK